MTQAVVFGGVNLPARTRLDATVSLSEVRQTDRFNPMTTNSVLEPLLDPLPEDRFDGRHRYELGYLRASGRPNHWLRWSAWARHWELDNRSASLEFPQYVMTDYQIPLCGNVNACGSLTTPIARRNLPFSWQKDTFGGQAGFRATDWLDVLVGYELRQTQRDHRGGKLFTSFVPGGSASGDTTLKDFPELTSKLTIAKLTLTHRLTQNLDATLRWWYELWHENNWASDQMQPYMGDPSNDPGSVTSIFPGRTSRTTSTTW